MSRQNQTRRRRISAVKALRTILKPHALLAIFLMFWCAGTGCMMVSYARAATSDSDTIVGQMSHSIGSMSMDAHACCKARRSSSKHHQAGAESQSLSPELNLLTTPSTPAPTGVMNCCPLTSGSVVVSSRSQSDDRATVLEPADSSQVSFVDSYPAPLAVPLRLPNRAHAYLLDCAFLI